MLVVKARAVSGRGGGGGVDEAARGGGAAREARLGGRRLLGGKRRRRGRRGRRRRQRRRRRRRRGGRRHRRKEDVALRVGQVRRRAAPLRDRVGRQVCVARDGAARLVGTRGGGEGEAPRRGRRWRRGRELAVRLRLKAPAGAGGAGGLAVALAHRLAGKGPRGAGAVGSREAVAVRRGGDAVVARVGRRAVRALQHLLCAPRGAVDGLVRPADGVARAGARGGAVGRRGAADAVGRRRPHRIDRVGRRRRRRRRGPRRRRRRQRRRRRRVPLDPLAVGDRSADRLAGGEGTGARGLCVCHHVCARSVAAEPVEENVRQRRRCRRWRRGSWWRRRRRRSRRRRRCRRRRRRQHRRRRQRRRWLEHDHVDADVIVGARRRAARAARLALLTVPAAQLGACVPAGAVALIPAVALAASQPRACVDAFAWRDRGKVRACTLSRGGARRQGRERQQEGNGASEGAAHRRA